MSAPPTVPLEIGARGWVTTSQAGAVLGVSHKTVSRWCESGRLSGARVGEGWWRITPPALERFAAAHRIRVDWDAVC
jgi:excisionase family DNA binding protein